MKMEVFTGKLLCVFLFLFVDLLASLLPTMVSKRCSSSSSTRCSKYHSVLNICNSFAGGTFLATCFVALLPFVRASYAKAMQIKMGESSIPLAEISLLLGFFFIILLEQLITFCQSRDKKGAKLPRPDGDVGEDEGLISDSGDAIFGADSEAKSCHSHGEHLSAAKSLLHSVVLVAALGMHNMFEGIAIGLQQNIQMLVILVIAVIVHEIVCGIALGINISQHQLSTRASVVICVIFSLMKPIGISIGLGLGEIQGFAGLIISASMQGLATGTFMYVLFLEIVPTSLSSSYANVQLAVMFAGAVIMSLIIVFTHGQHDGLSSTHVNLTSAMSMSTTLMP